MSTKNCKGDWFLTSSAIFDFSKTTDWEAWFLKKSESKLLDKDSPGLIILTKTKPIVTAKIVEERYSNIERTPILDNLAISFKLDIPLIKETKTIGTLLASIS